MPAKWEEVKRKAGGSSGSDLVFATRFKFQRTYATDMNEKGPWVPGWEALPHMKDSFEEMIELLKSIDKNVKEINAKLK